MSETVTGGQSNQEQKAHNSYPSFSDEELENSNVLPEVLGKALPQLQQFYELLKNEGEVRGLVGPREINRLWERHILNSAAVAPFITKRLEKKNQHSVDIADVGSGGGFPGIIVATIFPQCSVTLIEPMERRVQWLHEVVDALHLSNVTIERARADEVKKKFDIVTCRAVAPMTKLSGWTLPLLKNGGSLIALKGRMAQAEINKAAKEIRKNGGINPTVHEAIVGPGFEPTHVVTVIKNKRSA